LETPSINGHTLLQPQQMEHHPSIQFSSIVDAQSKPKNKIIPYVDEGSSY
jgi:hypothetical protein